MRGRSIIRKYALCAILCVLLILALLFAFLGSDRNANAGARAAAASNGLNTYSYDLIFRPQEHTLSVTMTLEYTNHTGDTLRELVLRTYAGAYASEETSPAAINELFDACYPGGFSAGGIAVEGVWWNGELADAAYSDEAQTVLRVSIPALENGAGGTLLMRCTLTIPACAHRFGYSGDTWQFGNALPILAVYQDGAWRADEYWPIGDPFVSECANYTVSILAPSAYRCGASGRVEQSSAQNGQVRFSIQASAVRDFAFALSSEWQCAQKKINGAVITGYAPTREGARRAADYTASALQVFSRLYGDYAYEQLTICAVDFPIGGMEYPGLILAEGTYFLDSWKDTLELLLVHETAHQWFYALVGSDQVFSAWQDEALCEYALLRYTLERYGRTAYENLVIVRVNAPMQERIIQPLTPGSPITYFSSLIDYSTVVYGRGAAFLLGVEEMTGQLDAFLRAYCDQFAFQLVSRTQFSDALNAFTGMDLTPLMTDYLDTLMN